MELLLVVATYLLLLLSSKTYTNAQDIECPYVGAYFHPGDRYKMLEVFNTVREHIVNERVPEAQYLEKAKNMYKLLWDCNMENAVYNAINPAAPKLTFAGKYAQNYAIIIQPAASWQDDPAFFATIAKNAWFNQIIYVGGLDQNQTYKDGLDFFANMVNAKATKVACSYKAELGYYKYTYKADSYWLRNIHYSCIFNDKPVKGQSIYERGTPCTKDAECTTYPGSICNTTTKLCEDVSVSNAIVTGSEYMTDAGRTALVNAHNEMRSLLATGQIRNGKNPSNANLPTAAFMSKMEYDKNLEAQALAHAKGCSLKKSDESTRTGFGENIGVLNTHDLDITDLRLLEIVVSRWWTQIFEDGINWQVRFKESLRDKEALKGIDQTAFTQMAWAKTSKIGCAVVLCSTWAFVVCRYSPAGNILDQPIYQTGSVCGGCPGTCNPADGLCIMT